MLSTRIVYLRPWAPASPRPLAIEPVRPPTARPRARRRPDCAGRRGLLLLAAQRRGRQAHPVPADQSRPRIFAHLRQTRLILQVRPPWITRNSGKLYTAV